MTPKRFDLLKSDPTDLKRKVEIRLVNLLVGLGRQSLLCLTTTQNADSRSITKLDQSDADGCMMEILLKMSH